MRTLLNFDQEGYEGTVQSITNVALKLVQASEEIEKLGAGKFEPKSLKNGNFIEKVLEFYKKEWATNAAFKHVSFERYLQFIELDLTNLKLLQQDYGDFKDSVYSFYPTNNDYFEYCEHRYKEGLKDAGRQIEIKIEDMYKLNEKAVTVNLNEEYFKLYATNAAQEEKVKDIEAFVGLAKKFNVEYKVAKQALGSWVKKLDYGLNGYEVDYYYLLQNCL